MEEGSRKPAAWVSINAAKPNSSRTERFPPELTSMREPFLWRSSVAASMSWVQEVMRSEEQQRIITQLTKILRAVRVFIPEFSESFLTV